MRSGLMLAVAVAVLGAAPASSGIAETSAGLADWQQAAVLGAHNGERRAVGVGPIIWSPRLAADAKSWAAHLAQTGMMMHYGGGREPDDAEGENLFMGTTHAYRIEQMVGYWADEKQVFQKVRRWDQNGETFEATGHYTQMVWRDTREVGCAIASNAENDFLVCRYAKAGNVLGQNPF